MQKRREIAVKARKKASETREAMAVSGQTQSTAWTGSPASVCACVRCQRKQRTFTSSRNQEASRHKASRQESKKRRRLWPVDERPVADHGQ